MSITKIIIYIKILIFKIYNYSYTYSRILDCVGDLLMEKEIFLSLLLDFETMK